jgi:transcriptional regulator
VAQKEFDMLIHPWDAAVDTTEWQDWLASTDRFGMLAVNNLDHGQAPIVLPLHFTVARDELLIHLMGADQRVLDGDLGS